MKKQYTKTYFIIFLLLSKVSNINAACPGTVAFTVPLGVCAGSAATFTNNTINGDSYIWKWGDATGNTIVNNPLPLPHTYALSGTYTVWLVRLLTVAACRDSVPHTVTIIAKPTASFTFTPNSTPCSLTPIQFTNTSTGTGLTYSWAFGDGGTSTAISPSHQYNAYGNGGNQPYTVTLTATNANGCVATVSQMVSVKNRPDASLAFFGGINKDCNSGSSPFDAVLLNNSQFTSSAINYAIDWGDGSPILSNNTFVPLSSASHSYSVLGYSNILFTITTASGCNDTAMYQFFKGSNPSVGLGTPGNTVGCLPISYTFPITTVLSNTPGTTYDVTVNDNTSSIAYTQSNVPNSITHLFNMTSCGTNAGTFTNSFKIEISATNPCGSSSAEVKPIVISEKPDASFTVSPTPNACTNQIVTFTNTSLPPNTATYSSNNYVCNTNTNTYWSITPAAGWTLSSGSAGIAGFVSGSDIIGVQFTQAGNYTIKLSVSGAASVCGNDTISHSICITNPVVPAFTVSNTSGCAPLNITTTNTTSLPTCGTNSYSWAVTYAATSVCDNASAFTFTNGTTSSSISPSFQFANAGTYSITLSVTNVCGTLTTSKTVVVKKKPLATVSSISGSCILPYVINPTLTDTNCAANALTYSWTFAGGTPATSTSAAPTNISFAATGNHIVTASVTNECGTTVATTNFTIVPNTPVTVSSNPTSICIGATATLTANNASNYSWSPATNLNTTSGATVTASPAITTTYTVTGTSGTCTSSAQVTVTVNPLPTVNISPLAPSICAGQNISLTASGANTYSWLPTTGLSVANAATVTANPSATTLYTVTGISASGCSNTQTINVIVKPLPTVIAGATPQQFCNTNTPVQLAGFSPAGGTWSGTGVTAAGVFTPSVVGVNSTILTYSCTDNITNCANSATITANVTNPTIANAGNGFSKCTNASQVALTGFTPAGGTWTGAGVTGNNFNPAGAAIGTNILTYSIGSGSCLSIDTIQVVVNPLPTINIAPANATLCVGQNVSLTASGANTYSWLPTTGLSVANAATVTANPTTTTPYTVTGISASGCSNTQTINVLVNPLPTVIAGATPQLFCNTNTPIQLAGFSPVGGTWSGTGVTTAGVFTPSVVGVNSATLTYSFTDNTTTCANSATITANVTNPTIANAGNGFSKCTNASQVALTGFTPAGGTWTGAGVTGNNFNPAGAAIGTNILTYSIGSGSCLSIDTIQVVVNPLPTINIAPANATLCVGQNVSLTASGANTYSWLPTMGLSVANAATVTANPITTTPYTVTGISASGCSNTQTINVLVNPLPTVIAGATPQLFCNTNTPVQLAGFSPAGGTWSGTGVTTAGVFTPSVVGVNSTILTFSYTEPVTNCTNSATITANVTNPTIANAGNGFSKCINASQVALTGFTPAGGTWTGAGVTGNDFNPAGAAIGTNILTYSIGSGSCLSTDTIQVVVNPLPTINISPANATLCVGQNISLTASGANTYSWLPTTGLSVANAATVTANPSITTLYTVTGISISGCSNTQTINVLVNPLPTVIAGATPQQFCNTNTPIQLAGYSPALGTWSGTGVTTAGVFTPSLAGIGPTTLTYTFTDDNLCVNSSTIIANVSSPQVADAGIGFSKCTNASQVALIGFTPAGGTWTGAGITGNDFDPSSASIGTNILTYSIGAASCLSTDTVHVIVNPLPTLVVSASQTTICAGDSSTLIVSGADTYSWTPTLNILNPLNDTISVHPLTTSGYSVIGTDVNGCINASNINVSVNQLPIVNAGIDMPFCNTNSTNQLSGFMPLTGTWSGNGIDANGLFNPSIPGNGIWDLVYSFEDSNNCINTDTIKATVTSPEVAIAGNGFSICTNASQVALTGFTPAGGTWTGAGITGNDFDPSSAAIGTNILSYSIGAASCLSTDTVHVIVNPLPTLVVSASQTTICAGDSSTLIVSGANTYSWTPTLDILNPLNDTISVHPPTSLTYSVIGADVNGCINTSSINVSVNQLPIVNAGIDENYCNQNISVQFSGFSPLTGTWSGNGIDANGLFNPSIPGNGIWDLVYSFEDSNNCTNTDTLKATVASPEVANAGNGFSICTNASPVALTGFTPSTGTWTGAGITGNDFDPSSASIGTNILTFSIGAASCLSTDTVLINVVALPTISVNANPTTICYGLSTVLNASGASTYSWIPNTGLSSNIGASVSAIPLSSIYYIVEGIDIYGCKKNDSIYINVNPLPIVNAGDDEDYCNQNIPVQFTGFLPLNGEWSGTGITTTGLYTPSVGGVGIFDMIYTFTDGNGCVNSDTLKSNVINPTQANAGLDTAICQSLATVYFAGLPSGGFWSGLHVSSAGIFTPDSAGNYTITYTFGIGTCQTSDTKNIIVHALPVVDVGPDIDICASAPPITLTTNFAGGTWQGNGITNSGNGIFNPSLIAPGTSTSIVYQVASSTTGCVNKDSLVLNVRPLPVVLFDSLPLGCANTNIQFINNTIGNNTFLWSFGDGAVSTQTQANNTYLTNDTFTVKLIATSNFGCVDSADHQIIITVPPVSNFFDNQSTVCGDQSISFTNTSFAQFSTFSWDFDNGIVSNLQTPAPIAFQLYAAADTNYYVTLTVDNICGTSSHADTIRLIAYPTADFAYYPQVVCAGSPISFSNASFGFGNSYKWFVNGNLVSANTILPNQTFTTTLTDSVYVVQLITTNFCGSVSKTDSIIVHPATVTAFFTVDSSFACIGETVNFISSVASYHHIVWKYGDGINSIDTLPYHNYLTSGTFTVWQIVYGYCGIDSIPRNVTISPNPTPVFSFVNPICGKDTAVFTNLTSGNNNFYSWNFGDGQSANNYSTSHHYFLSNNLTSTFPVKLIVTDATSLCKDSLISPITVLSNPIADFTILDNEICLGTPLVVNAVQSTGLNYVWNISNGETIVGNQMNYLFSDIGQYSFNLKVNDNFQCNDDTNYNFVFVRPNANANFVTAQQPPCAYNSNLIFTNGSSLSNSYLWDFGVNGNSNFQTPNPINFNQPTAFDATLIANNIYNCPDTITKLIEIVIKPKAIFVAPDSACQKQEFQMQNNSTNSTIFEWSTNGFIFSNQLNPIYESSNLGNLNLQLIATSNYDATCMDTAYKVVKVNEIPDATFNSFVIDTVIGGTAFTPCGGYFMFVPDFNKNDIFYHWSLDNGLTSTQVKPKAFYELNGNYDIELQVENRFGCINKTDTVIDVNCDGNIVLPNALAPSNSDTSLAWFIPKGKYIQKLTIEIFSPWGERVWFTDKLDKDGSPTEHWDGTYNNEPLPQGAFLVKVNATFSAKPAFIKTFYVTLVR